MSSKVRSQSANPLKRPNTNNQNPKKVDTKTLNIEITKKETKKKKNITQTKNKNNDLYEDEYESLYGESETKNQIPEINKSIQLTLSFL